MSSTNWASILLMQLWNVPLGMIYLVGIISAILTWRRHPAVSLLSLLSFGLLMVSLVMGGAVQVWQVGAMDRGWTARDLGLVMAVFGGIRICLASVAWILLLVALFGWRGAPAVNAKGV